MCCTGWNSNTLSTNLNQAMKKTFLHPILFALFLLAQPLFAQNQPLLTDVASGTSAGLENTRQANFPDLGKYLSDKLQYPELAQKNGVEGMVTVEAMIGEAGEVLSVHMAQGIGFGCDEAVMELVSNMPQWTPAIKNGQRVVQKVFIRAHFRLK